jgi:hypothetical protein
MVIEPKDAKPLIKIHFAGHDAETELFTSDPHTSLRLILILSPHFIIDISSGHFPRGFPAKILYALLVCFIPV